MASKHADFLLSIVVACYNEEGSIEPLLSELLPIVQKYRYEIIFVNDGSKDKTADIIRRYTADDKNIKLVSFVRNFGHQVALTAGYATAKGDCVLTIDADLQDPPELVPQMVQKWQEGYKVVYARRSAREEGFFKRITARLFYALINALSPTPIPSEVGDFRLVDRVVVDLINKMPERSRFLRGLVAWSGFPSADITFVRKKRSAGATHYTLSRMLAFALDGITSFSTKPLKIASYLGFITSILGFMGIVYAISRRLVLPHEYWVTGWTALFVAVMFFGGIQLITIGIIGEYIGKIYEQVKDRPMYIVAEKINM